MTDTQEPAFGGRQLRVGEVLALLVIVPAVAAAARALATGALTTPRWSAVFVGLFAGTVGLPVLAWLSERGRLGLGTLAGVGAGAGAIPPVLLALSGAIGLLFLGGAEYAAWALGHGASIPMYGTLAWSKFGGLVAWSASVGLASGLIYGLLVPSNRWRGPGNWALAVLTLAIAFGVGAVVG